MSLSPGARVAHYRLVRQLGAGGMGEVFLADDTKLDRQVAIKFLRAPTNPDARRRLLREARAAAALEHPSIVGIYEIGSDPDGGDYIVMPFVPGETLATRIRQGAMPVSETLTLVASIASALAVAHQRGVVHRDLKPQNIILTPSGLPKLLDFGLAKHADGSPAAAEAHTISQVTNAHTLVGTMGYMAPEQLRGDPVDPRSDLFALGCVLYECLTGRHAFTGSSSAEVLGQVLHVDPPSPSSLRPDADGQADALCDRLLQKVPANRFQSADEVLGAVRVLQGGSGEPTAPLPSRQASSRRLVAGGVLSVVILTALAVWQWQGRDILPTPSPEVMRSYSLALEALREGSYQVAEGNLLEAIRRDENFALAYVRLAEAYAELDKLSLAKDALVRVGRLVPNRNRLAVEDALRIRGVEAYVLREHGDAVATYRTLAERTPTDPGGWVDLGRAEDNAGQGVVARQHFERARDLDKQYAPARVRLGTLLGQLAQTDAAIVELDEAIRIYRTTSNSEGLAEAMVRKTAVLTSGSRYPAARTAIEETLALAVGPRFAYQRVRARFAHARLTSIAGQFTDAMTTAASAVDEAKSAGLGASASSGLREMGLTLALLLRFDEADKVLTESITLARQNSAELAEMRARLQQASLRNNQYRFQEALDLSEEPLTFFTARSYTRNAAEAQIIRAYAHERLDHLVEAENLTRDVLKFAEDIKDARLIADNLENLVGQLEALGRFPAALKERRRIEDIYRSQGNHGSLAFSLVNRANLLTQLGRSAEADAALDELEQQIGAGTEAYLGRRTRGKLARALLYTTQGLYDAVAAHAEQAQIEARSKGAAASASAVSAALSARVLAEHAAARLGRSRLPLTTIALWPAEAKSAGSRLEVAYWATHILLVRQDAERAAAVALTALADPAAAPRPELRWRLGAVAGRALATQDPARSATIRAAAEAALDELRSTWDASYLKTYLSRADLVGLSKR